MSYAPVGGRELFNADNQVEPDGLTFKDFGTGGAVPGSRPLSPSTGLYEPDVAMQRQVGSSGFFSLSYFSQWFDVDTMLVFERAWRTMYPRDDFIETVLNGTPDLYGPFWLPTTLIFALFFSSSLASSITAYLSGARFSYDFTRLSVAVSVVYFYALGFPAGLWAVMRYWAGVDGRNLVDLIAIWGYGMTVWIPVALLSIPPVVVLRLVFSVLAYILSMGFLLRNIYPALASSPQKAARGLVVAVVLAHTVLAIIFWFSFLNNDSSFLRGGRKGTSGGSPADEPAVDVPGM